MSFKCKIAAKYKVIAGLNKQSLLTAFKESIDSGDIKDALEEFHHEYMSHQQYDDDEDEHLGDDEMYERTLDYLDKRWQKFKTNFKADFLDGRLVVWREVKLKTSKDKINTDKVGVYWSWDKEKAQSWWGKHEHSVMLKATVDLSSIDIHMTLASNLYKEHILENEIRLKSGAKVQLLEPIQKAVTATIVIRVKNSSKIK